MCILFNLSSVLFLVYACVQLAFIEAKLASIFS